MALQLERKELRIPGDSLFRHSGKGGEKVGIKTQCAPSPLLANQDKAILEVGFYNVLGTSGKFYGASAASPPTELIYMWLGILADCLQQRQH